jgi:5-methylcytosine-specific restriction endonuclease McrA
MQTFILDYNGKQLMPTDRTGMVRRWLKSGKAKIVKHDPFFTIKFTNPKEKYEHNQPLVFGLDTGYSYVGFSVINSITGKEIFGGQLQLRCNISELLKTKKMFKRQRNSKKRYRKPGTHIKYSVTHKGWTPPSVRHKIDTTKRLIDKIISALPIQEIHIELGKFDMARMIDPDIHGVEYQKGEQYGFYNVREAVLYRDNHVCQNPDCPDHIKTDHGKTEEEKLKNRKFKPNSILTTHHIVFKGPKHMGSDRASNLITLCDKCHTHDKHHDENGILVKWLKERKKAGNLKGATFMNIVSEILTKELPTITDIPFKVTYGFITKSKRIDNHIEKTHHGDAFIIAGGTKQENMLPGIFLKTERRNNRALTTFRDSKWWDKRELPNKVVKSGKELFCGRSNRNKNLSGENLRQYRVPIIDEKTGKRKEITKGKLITRTTINPETGKRIASISKFPPGSKVMLTQNWECEYGKIKKNQTVIVAGTQNNGKYVIINKYNNRFKIPLDNKKKILISSKICKLMSKRKGIIRETIL